MFEYILAGILNHIKNFNSYFYQKQSMVWRQLNYKTISSTHVAFMGLGEIGGYAARKCSEFGFKVSGWAASVKNINGVCSYTGLQGLKDMFKETDVLVNILPVTKETINILNADAMKQLKKGAYIINAGRGEHLAENDLVELVSCGHISGALLDVFEEEPLPKDSPLWQNEKISITPHTAAITNIQSAAAQIVDNFYRLKKNEVLLNVVSIEKGY